MKEKQETLLSTLAAGIVLLLAVLCRGGGYLHWESSAFILNYTADRPLLEILFDPAKNDWGLYQCRELSYFFDWLDSQAVFALLKLGKCWFVSISAAVSVLLTIWVQQEAGRRLFPRLPGIFWTLHALSFALLPALAGHLYFRSSKFIVMAGVTVLIFGTALRCCDRKAFWGKLPVLGTAAFLAVFCDRQGVFFVTAFAGILSVMQLRRFRRAVRPVLFVCAGTVFLQFVCNLLLVPGIIRALNGYEADFSYQGKFKTDLSLLSAGTEFVTANCGHAFAGLETFLPAAGAGIALLCLIAFLLRRHRCMPGWCFPAALLAGVICSGLMALRHPALLDEDVLFSNYFLPLLGLLSFFYFAALAALPGKFVRGAFLLPLLALSLRLQPYLQPEQLFKEDKFQKTYQEATVKLRYVLENPGCDYKRLLMPARMERLVEKLSGRR